jgi:type II secretory pathway component GspD/PulD (secretin)
VRLEITPRVDSQGEITATIYPQVSAITGFTKEGYPRISTREAQTTVRVKNGETIAIGGLIESREIQRTYGLPVLSEIPIIGKLFSTTKDSSETTELVILVTFKIMSSEDSRRGFE